MGQIINGRQYEWADLQITLGGKALTAIRGISYTEKMDKEALYGKGRTPLSIQRGNYSVEGEIKLLQSELETLVASSPNKSILNLIVDAVVCYGGNIEGGAGSITTDKILGIQFTEVPKSLNQEDKFMEVTLPFIALRVLNQQ